MRTFYFKIYSRDFVNKNVFFAARFTLRQPKTPVRNATNLRTFLFWRLLLCLSRDSLSCDTRSLDLWTLFKFIFLYFWYIPPHSYAFHTFYFTPIFSYVYITTRNIFLIPDDAVARNLIIVYNFSSQRLRLNYLFLSNVYSFDTIEFSMKHKY